jgi:hypothetical protein
MHEGEDHDAGATNLVSEQQYLRGLAGLVVVLALLFTGIVAFVRYLL